MNKYLKRFTTLSLLLVMFSLLATACAPKTEKTKKEVDVKTAKKTKLTFGTMPAPDSLPVYVADKLGYFKDENLDVDLKQFQSPKERDAAISANQLDGAISDMVAYATYQQGGLDWKIGSQATGYFAIVTNNPEIKSMKDLKNKTYALMPGQTPQFYLSEELTKNKLSLDDLKLTEIPQIPVRMQMVGANKADITVVPDPFITMAKGQKMNILAESNPNNFKSTIYTFSNKTLKNNKSAVVAFYKAYDKAVKYINSHNTKDMKGILTKDIGYKEEAISHIKLPKYNKATQVKESDLQKALDYSKEQNIYHKNDKIKSYLADVLK